MDIEQARTFLAVNETGSFQAAAERVHVTQSTVSARIRALEDQLGQRLFVRNKTGARPTVTGQRFLRHALGFVRLWEQARMEVALPPGVASALTIGGSPSLWDGFLVDWLGWIASRRPGIAVRGRLGLSETLMAELIDGTLDLAVLYTPQARPGLVIERLFEERLVLVSSEARPGRAPGRRYVYIDWGPEFGADHALAFPALSTPAVHLGVGALAMRYLLNYPASAYFPERLVGAGIAEGRLRRVGGAPTFTYPVFAVYSEADSDRRIERAMAALRQIARQIQHHADEGEVAAA